MALVQDTYEFVVFEVGDNLLRISTGTLLETLDFSFSKFFLLKFFLHGLHITLQ